MKIIDRLLVKSFLPPFAVTFMIATFVLLIQILWVYIDDLTGKGLGFLLITELLAYKCVSLVPMALPLALLISSVMVLGNLAEHYELSSFKSAGVSLFRVMGPMAAFGFVCAGVSYYCSDYLIPVSNLKFGSRMYDIQRQKPALRLDDGVFNDDFQGFAIRIGNKKSDGQGIEDVLIYDHKSSDEGSYNQINARSGKMFTAADQKYFVMKLRDGHQYTEPRSGSRGNASSPFIRTNFKVWTRVFDLSEFDLQRTNEDLFKSNRSMLSVRQLQDAIDSMAVQELDRRKASAEQVNTFIALPPPDTSAVAKDSTAQTYQPRPPVTDTAGPQLFADSSMQAGIKKEAQGAIKIAGNTDSLMNIPVQMQDLPQQTFTGSLGNLDPNVPPGIRQELTKPIEEYESLVKTFISYEQPRLVQSALTQARSLKGQAEANASILSRMKKNRVKFIYDLHMKYVFAAMCVVFLFIGAPMGAIVRKGGFGFPILIATIFFVLFIILTIFCRKIAEAFIVPGNVAAWLPCMLFIPLGLYLTIKAMNDSEVFRFEALGNLLRRLRPAKKAEA